MTARGLGPFGSFARDLSGFMLGKGLGPAADLMEDKDGGAAKTWFAHGIFWFIIAATLSFLGMWTAYEPTALDSLSAIGYSPTEAQSIAAVHVVTAFGALSMVLMAGGFAVQSKLSNGRMANESTTALLAFVWSAVVGAGLILAHTDLIGTSLWFELPPIYYMLLSLLALPLFANHLLTMARSNSVVMIPQWFIVMGYAAFIWLGFQSMFLLGGENHTLSWLLVKVLFGGWLFSQALGIAHHVIPAKLGTPLWSRSLANLALLGTFLTFSPLGAEATVPEAGDFQRAVVAILLSLSLLPIIATVVNLTKTASGRAMESYGVKFTLVGTILLVPIALGSMFASVSAFGGGNELAHISSTFDMMAMWGVIGMIALGGVHLLFPEVSGRELFSSCKTKLTFWFATIGIIGFSSAQLIADYVNNSINAPDVVLALEDAGVSATGAGDVQIFAAMMFYGVALAGIFAAQNMLQGSFRGNLFSDAAPSVDSVPSQMDISGTTSIRSLLAAGAGADTILTVESGSSVGRISLADITPTEEPEEVEEVAETVEEQVEEEAVEIPANLSSLLKVELVNLANDLGISSKGTKAALIERINSVN
jgi:hypothetical protein